MLWAPARPWRSLPGGCMVSSFTYTQAVWVLISGQSQAGPLLSGLWPLAAREQS